MKKILLAVAFLLCLSAMSFAQSKDGAKKPEKQAASQKAQIAKKDKAVTDTAKKAKPANAPKAMAGPLKKDGTPDKRYKENKESAEVVHKKKDGTPDKRFKENKKKS